MNYAEQQKNSGKHAVGFGIVVLLHLVLGWALVNGLAQRMVEVIKGPIETKIIEDKPPPPPPPPENLPPPPKFAPPPPSYVPPPEIQVNPPPTPAPTITTVTTPPPPAPVAIAPAPAPVAPPAPAAPPRPVISNLRACAPTNSDYPKAAVQAEVTGSTTVRLTIGTNGQLVDAKIVKSAGQSREAKLLDRMLLSVLSSRCTFQAARGADGQPVEAYIDQNYEWKLE